MSESRSIQGIVAYPVTPFLEDRVDIDRLIDLVDTLVRGGADAVAPLGSTGESAYLSFDEWFSVVEASVRATGSRVPVVVGCSDLTTTGSVDRAVAAQRAGADAVMIIPISYWPLKDDEIVAHYRAISDAIDIPIMAYNNPATAGIDMRPELLVRLVNEVENVTMVKESTGDITRMAELVRLTGGSLPFFNGSNPLIVEAVAAGAAGWCTAAPCLLPEATSALYHAASSGDNERADRLYRELQPFLRFIVSEGLPAAIKSGLQLQGKPAGDPRRPLLPLDDEKMEQLQGLLSRPYALT